MKKIACCHIPTQVLIVDDDAIFLKSLSLKLRRHRAIHQYESSLSAALAFDTISPPKDFFSMISVWVEEKHREKKEIKFDISQLHKLIYQPGRFDTIGILIVDYTMPGLNGLDLCRKAPNHIKRILLTGDADEKIAVEAFNNGLIDRYIKKDTSDITRHLEDAIADLELKFFHEISGNIVSHLQRDKEHPLLCFQDPDFTGFVQNHFKRHEIIEHYLLDSRGSLLGLDPKGNYVVMAVRDTDDMRAAAEIAELADEQPATKVLKATAERNKLLFTGHSDDFSVPVNQWEMYLYPVDFVDDQKSIFASFISEPKIKIDRSSLVSFSQYLENFYSSKF